MFKRSLEKFYEKYSAAQILVISFVLVILCGTALLLLPVSNHGNVSLLDALFTSVSATCVTGLMTVSALNDFTFFGQIIILLMIQIGGLGLMSFVTLTLLLINQKLDMKERSLIKDSLNKSDDHDNSNYLRKIFRYTIAFEGLGFLALLPKLYDHSAYSIFQTLFLSISAFCNAGIDILGTSSLLAYQSDWWINMVISLLIIFGGLGFAVWFDLRNHFGLLTKGKEDFHFFWKKLKVHTKLVLIMTLVLILSGTIFFFSLEYNASLNGLSFPSKLLASLFQSITLRTAGFSSVDYSLLNNPTKIFMIIFMIIGASPGGTGGGMKTTTFFLLIYTIYSQLKNQDNMVIFKHHISRSSFIKATSIFSLYLFCLIISMMLLTGIEQTETLDLLFEAASAVGTVGLSVGITASLGSISKVIIILLMFIGRLGPITIAMTLKKNAEETNYIRYPKTDIIVG